jgi:Spy/CpxP family protein refolding chaperone
MRVTWLTGLAVLALAVPAVAQQGGRPERPEPPERPGLRQGHPGLGGVPLRMLAHRLARELELTDAQREQYDQIVAKYEAQTREQHGQRDDMRELAEQYREARRSGDQQRAEEIRARMQEMGGGRGQVFGEFLTEVEKILDKEQLPKLNAFRERLEERGDAARRAAELRDLVERLPDELQLNEQQRATFDALVAEQRKLAHQQIQDWQQARPALAEELREAREAGDEGRVAELLAQLEAERPAPPDPEDLLDQLEPSLTAEQKAKLAKLRAELVEFSGRPVGDVETILRAAKRLDLSDQQEEQLKAIIRDARAAERDAPRDPQARAERAKLVKKQVLAVLNADQAAEFERLLARERQERPLRRGVGQGGMGKERGEKMRRGNPPPPGGDQP